MISSIAKWLARLSGRTRIERIAQSTLRGEQSRILREIRQRTPDSPALHGAKAYSQCDEDGIIAAIFDRIGPRSRTFLEIGCGNGLENNTHALLLCGWSGMWVDANTRNIQYIRDHLPESTRLTVHQVYVDRHNAADLATSAAQMDEGNSLDFLSVDIDGDDLGVLLAILQSEQPRVICVEYNAKFPPPMEVAVGGASTWSGDDYHGASLTSIAYALGACGYMPVCCNTSGANVFFVCEADSAHFSKYPLSAIFRPSCYELGSIKSGHAPSLKFLANELKSA